jgi:hypothetical protein
VDDVGVHHHELVGMDGEPLVVDLKLTVAAHNIKKLRIAVGVGDGVPVAAVFGRGYISQNHLLAGRRLTGEIECVIGMAHGGTSFASILLYILLYW